MGAARQIIWGNRASGTSHFGPTIGLLTAVTLQVYGRVPAKQDIATGNYSDTIVVTLNY